MYVPGDLPAVRPQQGGLGYLGGSSDLGDLGNIFGTIWGGIKKGAGALVHAAEAALPNQQQLDAATVQWLHSIGQSTVTNTANTPAGQQLGTAVLIEDLKRYAPLLILGGAGIYLATHRRRGPAR